MKELILLRHAKSDWGNEGLLDVDRHLNARGYEDAYIQSNWMTNERKLPDLIVSSTATRALSTALIFFRTFKFAPDQLKLEEKIYEASVKTLLSIIENQNNKNDTLLLVGHNPGITEISNHFAGEMYFDNIPTCGLVSIKIETETWKNAGTKKANVNYYQFPKSYRTKN